MPKWMKSMYYYVLHDRIPINRIRVTIPPLKEPWIFKEMGGYNISRPTLINFIKDRENAIERIEKNHRS